MSKTYLNNTYNNKGKTGFHNFTERNYSPQEFSALEEELIGKAESSGGEHAKAKPPDDS